MKTWLLAARPKTLVAAIAPVMMGSAMAYSDGMFYWLTALLALLGALSIQIGTNYANDYFDFIKGADTKERVGPRRITQSGMVTPKKVKDASITMFLVAAFFGIHLIMHAGWPILIIGIFSIASGLLYTGGPYPLGYNGLGDIFVFIFFGPIAVCGTYYVQGLILTPNVIIASLALGFLATAILAINNLRDIDTDRKSNKRTLAVLFGKTFVRWEYTLSFIFAAAIPLVLWVRTGSHIISLFSVATLIGAIPFIIQLFRGAKGDELNRILGLTGTLLLFYSFSFSIGWIL